MKTYVCIFAALLLLGLPMYYMDFCFQELHYSVFDLGKNPKDFVVNIPGCRIPSFDPFDPLVKGFIKHVDPVGCELVYPMQLIDSNLTAMFVVNEALPKHNVTDAGQLHCCYTPFWRIEGNTSNFNKNVDNKIEFAQNCTPFQNETRINDEFLEVLCKINGTMIYHDYHAFIPLKDSVEERCEHAKRPEHTANDESLSVLIVGIDAVSRLNFHRQMPLTNAFLRDTGGIEMLGYNKVADNTFPNLVPVLSGLTEEELQTTCWPSHKTAFDACPWLWKKFSEAGYRTAFGEDAPWMGIFSYSKFGFAHQPTDYYMRPYSKLYEDKAGHSKKMNAKLCIGPRLTAEVLLQYMSKFSMTMASKRSFGLFWGASLTHDLLNYPQLGDALHENVLRDLLTIGALNNTLLIVMSDHGIRWGPIRQTYQGRVEERLPLLYFMFPPWFKDKHAEAVANLKWNIHRLTTPFDLHETLTDLIDLETLEKDPLRARALGLNWKNPPRGVSLFLPIDKSRTCETAGISPHWCTCQQSEPLALDSPSVDKMARFVVTFLNSLLDQEQQCSKLNLTSVHDARVHFPGEHLTNDTSGSVPKEYVLAIETTPGGGVFEATVIEQPNNTLTVAGTVSRLNIYGNQSACVTDYHMKLYCYCDCF